jgi:TPP-dependent pyruvate/acetoin dehydrogenase alpha subunit
MLGANGIVGGGIPIAVGVAHAMNKRRERSVVMCFFGDGANNEGAFHEALNLAAIWKLPVIFVCENNGYGMSTSTERSTAVVHVAERAAAYAMPGVIVDGNRFADVAQAAFDAVERARDGLGPTLIESKTYRIRGHSRSDRNRYRTNEEIEAWQARDPIRTLELELGQIGLATIEEIEAIRADVEREIAAALEFAKASPSPRIEELTRYVYTE